MAQTAKATIGAGNGAAGGGGKVLLHRGWRIW